MLENVVKITQVIFYCTVGTVAVLTFLKAKRTLLNAVNTEYNKHVIDRLAELSEELFSEFEDNNANNWLNHNMVQEHFEAFCVEYRAFKEKFAKREPEADDFPGTPTTKRHLELIAMERKVRSDPFIPKKIRLEILAYLRGRLGSMLEAEALSFRRVCAAQLAADRPLEKSEILYGIHNTVNDFQYGAGYGIGQCEEKVEEIRLTIQRYFEAFDPLAREASVFSLPAWMGELWAKK